MLKVVGEFRNEYRFLSNFYPSTIVVGPWKYPTVEHYYQAAKTTDQDYAKKITWAGSPGEAKKLGKSCPIRKDWDLLKDSFMMQGLKLKFSQNQKLKQKLIDTKAAMLVEGNTWGDVYWGYDLKLGYGQNRLGQLLMIIRLWAKDGKI